MSDKPSVTFVNSLAVNGFHNGIINLTFTTARWTLAFDQDGKPKVNPDPYVSALLRMDLKCAMEVRDALDQIIREQTVTGGTA